MDLIGIGASKSATTWIAHCLDEHPDICIHPDKEVHFFNDENRFSLGKEWYEKWQKTCPDDALIGEFTPTYLVDPEAPRRIYSMYPNVKLLVCLREPINRSFSNIQHMRTRGRIAKNASVEEVAKAFPHTIENSRYAK